VGAGANETFEQMIAMPVLIVSRDRSTLCESIQTASSS
jgi:hypothetical protein